MIMHRFMSLLYDIASPPKKAIMQRSFETMIEGSSAQRIMADKAYASRANREC